MFTLAKALPAVLLALALAPATAQAQPRPGPKGGFSAGQKFKLRVVQTQHDMEKFPAWIPKLKRGKTVTFKIGKKGQLTLPSHGLSLKLIGTNTLVNTYSLNEVPQVIIRDATAQVIKNSKSGIAEMNLVLSETEYGGPEGVRYVLKKYQLKP